MKSDSIIKKITEVAGDAAGVPVYHAPSPAAGEKIIYRFTPGGYDGEFETITVIMRFISRDLAQAMKRAEDVSGVICRRGERGVDLGGEKFCGIREEGGGSGYIGKTGHFYVMSRFEIKFRRSCAERYVVVRPAE